MSENNFLFKVAKRLLSMYKEDFHKLVLIFPSKRSHLFFTEELTKLISRPTWLPVFYSIDDFIFEANNFTKINSMELFFDFYSVYKDIINDPHNIEKCYKWAPSILEDFNDIDKASVNYIELFNYLSDSKRIDSWELDLDKNNQYIGDYLNFFKQLPAIYENLRDRLLSKNSVYPGIAHRQLANHPSKIKKWLSQNKKQKIIFIGIDALTLSQEKIINHLLKHKIADIIWDTDDYFINNPKQSSAVFIRRYQKMWPNKFKEINSDFRLLKKEINIIGAPKTVLQSKLLGTILGGKKYKNQSKLKRVAVVLPNENLLLSVLDSIPEHIKDINITMGYKLSNHPIVTVYLDLIRLFVNSKKEHKQIFYSKKDVISLFLNPFSKFAFNDFHNIEGFLEGCRLNSLNYLSKEFIINTFDKDNHTIYNAFNSNVVGSIQVVDLLIEIVNNMLSSININSENKQIELECLFEIDTHLKTIRGFVEQEDISIRLLLSLFEQSIKSIKLNFSGEPLKGIQILGVLETRTVDFDEVIILSANEGFLPPNTTYGSFIPFDIKRKYKMRTHLDNDAIYANHFFNLIKRPKKTHIIYDNNNSSPSFGSGEKSRLISQLIYEIKPAFKNIIINESLATNNFCIETPLELGLNNKDPYALGKLRNLCKKGLSPTTITTYNSCPRQFYFEKILELKRIEDVSDSMDSSMIGKIIHSILERLYTPHINKRLTNSIMDEVKSSVLSQFNKTLNKFGVKDYTRGKNLLVTEAIKSIVVNFVQHESNLVNKGNEIIILMLEYKTPAFKFDVSIKGEKINLTGFIDRVDLFNGSYRIIDYKTGMVQPNELKCKNMSDLHGKPKLFQLVLYAWLFNKLEIDKSKQIYTGIINIRASSFSFQKALVNNSHVINDEILSEFEKVLDGIIYEMFDTSIAFHHELRDESCRYCD